MEAERAQREADLERGRRAAATGTSPSSRSELAEREAADRDAEDERPGVPQGGGRRRRRRRGGRAAGPGSRSAACWRAKTEKLLHMEERLHERVVGQDEAIEAVATALRRSRAGLSDPDRPIGSFLFLGPTGVGKTELARALAEFMFDTQDAMIRIDMSRVHGEALRLAAGRRAPRLRRLRRGRPADRGGPPAPLRRGPARRDREGPRRRLQHAPAGDGRRAPDRRPGPDRGLQEHRPDHDLEHPRPRGPRRRRAAQRPARVLQARVHQPPRRHRPLPRSRPRAARRDRRPAGGPRDRAGGRARCPGDAHRQRPSSCSATSATTPPTGPGRCAE